MTGMGMGQGMTGMGMGQGVTGLGMTGGQGFGTSNLIQRRLLQSRHGPPPLPRFERVAIRRRPGRRDESQSTDADDDGANHVPAADAAILSGFCCNATNISRPCRIAKTTTRPCRISRISIRPCRDAAVLQPGVADQQFQPNGGEQPLGTTSTPTFTPRANGSLSLQGLDACKPVGLAYSGLLADLFLELPIVKEFKRGRYKLSKIGGSKHLATAIHEAWREFERKSRPSGSRNGHGPSKPAIAVLQIGQENGSGNQPRIAAGRIAQSAGSHRAARFSRTIGIFRWQAARRRVTSIDVVFRLLLTRELLARFDLSHPLLRAYRDRAVCVVNSFRSEFAQRRSLFELLTDDAVTAHLSAADRKLIRTFVPWTRIVRRAQDPPRG